ncbi:MAG: hypothetical protein IMW89_08225 [Ktedonobacteraceae bacterium]|nr:hypothetical protein [Ktedonobacteraceae bacterium]
MKPTSFPSYRIAVPFLILFSLLLVACTRQADTTQQMQQNALKYIRQYAQDKTAQFAATVSTLQSASNDYYTLTKANNFDYKKLAKEQASTLLTRLNNARTAWLSARSTYNQVEGITAQVTAFQLYDLVISSGVAPEKEEGQDNDDEVIARPIVTPIDLTLPNGKILKTPGSLLSVLAEVLWELNPEYDTKVPFDYQVSSAHEVGNTLPDANALKGAADTIVRYANELASKVNRWQPTLGEVFSCLRDDLTTIDAHFGAWASIIFSPDNESGQDSSLKDFDDEVNSRLYDFADTITGWQNIYAVLSPLAHTADSAADTFVTHGLSNLRHSIFDLYMQQRQGKTFTYDQVSNFRIGAVAQATAVNDHLGLITTKLKIAPPAVGLSASSAA